MTEQFSKWPSNGNNVKYTFQPSSGSKNDGVIRCTFCNKFMNFQKYYKNNCRCYHCGGGE